MPEFSYRNNIWRINNGYGYSSEDDIAHKHPAIFPEQLAQDHIWTWSNEGDIVYDCFGGSGTTAKMAHKLKRNWILSEIRSEYVQIAEKELEEIQKQAFATAKEVEDAIFDYKEKMRQENLKRELKALS